MGMGGSPKTPQNRNPQKGLGRRAVLLSGTALVAAAALGANGSGLAQAEQTLPPTPSPSSDEKPNIVVIFGDDIGQSNISAYTFGLMGYKTSNIDRIAREGMMFTDYYAEQSCTAGRSSFITGQHCERAFPRSGFRAPPLGYSRKTSR